MPRAAVERLLFVPLLDGRAVSEWARATLMAAVAQLMRERPGWAWARPGAPWWRDPGVLGVAGGPPAGALAGGERVLVLAVLEECFDRRTDPEGDGVGVLADVAPGFEGGGVAGVVRRRVLLRACDVLPWRRSRAELAPIDAPGIRGPARRPGEAGSAGREAP